MKTFFDKHLKVIDMTIDLVPPDDIAVEPSSPGAK
jgi:hypothetical protein